MKLLIAILPLFLASITVVRSQAGEDPVDEGIQDSVFAFGTHKCATNSKSQGEEDIMIDCLSPKNQKGTFTTHPAADYTDEVPTMFKSFHGSNAGLKACVYSFNSTTTTVASNDFKHALAAIPVGASTCSDVPKSHQFAFLNKKQKIKSFRRAAAVDTTLSVDKTKKHPKVTGDIHRYVCLLEDSCQVGNL